MIPNTNTNTNTFNIIIHTGINNHRAHFKTVHIVQTASFHKSVLHFNMEFDSGNTGGYHMFLCGNYSMNSELLK